MQCNNAAQLKLPPIQPIPQYTCLVKHRPQRWNEMEWIGSVEPRSRRRAWCGGRKVSDRVENRYHREDWEEKALIIGAQECLFRFAFCPPLLPW
ncbi:hypothetical protein ASPSYDRAFT_920903 [Aspergillus sydowii CBS 593.65]|uniref:Uncharacterized protein n=1 Tax=Aspergillus sydowii CBS 593.65 TaxID=1036612 RepID=A0A1L9TKW7_9EURO|nr:uncharacterized protein ASPSYDRAFT_920903 [Aspergillus sydowii CBS 593.65]OJJ60067.1 hypothetical protein ASPSYDRAFT_920903 [Aspergillus sydowii CBS 593.65]